MSRQDEGVFKERVMRDLKDDWGDDIDILATQERGRKGVADLVICLRAVSIRIELKVDGEKPTKLQQLKLDRHDKAGGLSFYSTPCMWDTHRNVLRHRFGYEKS